MTTSAHPFAWIVRAENGNTIIWTRSRHQAEASAERYERPTEPLYLGKGAASDKGRTATTDAARELRDALSLTAGALAASARNDDPIRFTGRWSHLGSRTVGSILDQAENALARTPLDDTAPTPKEPL